jgi:hypothetical protein
MLKYCKYMLLLLVIVVCSTITVEQNHAQKAIFNFSTIERIDSNSTSTTCTDGKLPKPIQPVKKKQTNKRLLVSKRAPFTVASCGISIFFANNNSTCFQESTHSYSYPINGFTQALITHNSLFYLF